MNNPRSHAQNRALTRLVAMYRDDYRQLYAEECRLLGLKVGIDRPVQCGTSSGYVTHRRKGEEPCPACRKARRAYQADLRQRQLAEVASA